MLLGKDIPFIAKKMNFFEKLIDWDTVKSFHFLYELVLIWFFVKIAGHLSKKIGQPSVMGELLAGVILGPAMLGWLHPTPLIKELAEIGVILLMFLAGLETDIKEFMKSAFASTSVAICGIILPFIGGWVSGLWFGFDMPTSIFIGTLLVATSVSISVQTLRELGKLQSKEGVTILGAAVLDDILGIIILSLVIGFTAGSGGSAASDLIFLFVKIILFFILVYLVGKKILPWVFRNIAHLMTTEVVLTFGLITALGFAFLAEMMGLAGIVGSYFAGLMLSLTPQREELFEKVETVSFSFFVPIFFASIGLIANIEEVNMTVLIHIVTLTIVAVFTKLIGGAIGAKIAKFNNRSSMGIGAGMIARGEVGLIVASIGLSKGLINNELFTATIVIVLVTTLVTPPLLKIFFTEKKSFSR
ncbi:cation:proton antiporter [Thermoflavimicrobium dichotomicum]|uniref:Transporter, monovalent cation:proton antiporter-2 (CPA2) family n=1 Tax=Thermoflavimicrobium dichotomicum TaxID=46223 RepID=A0A1I3NFG3_9BACL|nr:cation:proton antiporter [Thermoflavimicrobium dichotomicum]SFJ07882.1 transporter, monovalent cation:proton antiporter-2 (CPA2) family [Thermoflavimicrobium dichotomicum]